VKYRKQNASPLGEDHALFDDPLEDLYNQRLARHTKRVLGNWRPPEKPAHLKKLFYGVDGNLLVDDLWQYGHDSVNAVLDGTYVPRHQWAFMLPGVLYQNWPQLIAERDKRRHRKAYRANLEARRRLLVAMAEEWRQGWSGKCPVAR
jgi:hypothetical protein